MSLWTCLQMMISLVFVLDQIGESLLWIGIKGSFTSLRMSVDDVQYSLASLRTSDLDIIV